MQHASRFVLFLAGMAEAAALAAVCWAAPERGPVPLKHRMPVKPY